MHRRRRWLVSPAYQWRVTGAFLGLFTLFAAVLVVLVRIALYTAMQEVGVSDDAVFRAVSALIMWTVVAELLLLLPVLVIVSIVLTHQVVGPISRILGALERFAHGDYDAHLSVRKRDVLVELAEGINRLGASLRKRVKP